MSFGSWVRGPPEGGAAAFVRPSSKPSHYAKLVIFGIVHHHVSKVIAVGLFSAGRGPSGDQFGHLRADELLPFGHIPWRLSGYPDVEVHPVLGRFRLGHLEETDGWTLTVRIDDRCAHGVVIAGFGHIAERQRPE
jgi:hypothetical protein